MARKRILPRYVQWRDGRPRWELGGAGGRRLRESGFRSIDLKDEAGEWLSFEQAREAGRRLNAAVDTWRAGQGMDQSALEQLVASLPAPERRFAGDFAALATPAPGRVTPSIRFDALINLHRRSDHWRGVSEGSRQAYTARGNVIKAWIGDLAVDSIKPSHGRRLFQMLLDVGFVWHEAEAHRPGVKWHEHVRDLDLPAQKSVRARRFARMDGDDEFAARPAGYASAFYVMAYARELIAWARREHDLLIENPFSKLGLSTPKGRIRYVEADEILHIVATADAMGLPEVGDAACLAVNTVQRRGDLLRLPWSLRPEGRFRVVQEKTGEVINCRFTKALQRRLDAAWARARDGAAVPGPSAPILPFSRPQALTDAWSRVRAKAAKSMPSVADVLLHDLRDTGFTRLIEAGCSLVQACNVSGHSLGRAATIEKAYLAKRKGIADAAIDKVDIFMERGGITL